jgi:beta-galactosidase
LLVKGLPETPTFAGGDAIKLQWILSDFADEPLKESEIEWDLTAEGKTIASGKSKVDGRSEVKIPAVEAPFKAKLTSRLAGTSIRNTWDIWLFPRVQPSSGKGIAASDKLYAQLSNRYPHLSKLADTSDAKLVITDTLNPPTLAALAAGKTVLYLGLADLKPIEPGVKLGWWNLGKQRGTAIAEHPLWWDFPQEGYLSPAMFALIGRAVPTSEMLSNVEPLMVGHSDAGYLLHVFAAKVGPGKLLACGLNVLADRPEGAYLLDQMIRQARSASFDSKGTLDPAALKTQEPQH